LAIAVWLVGALVVHDLVLAPAVVAAGWAATRVLPAWLRAPVQAAALVGLTVTLASVPLLSGRGRRPGNPSADPLDYPRNLALVLLVVCAVCSAWAAARWMAGRQRHSAVEHHEGPTG
jgi:hypothetical protein